MPLEPDSEHKSSQVPPQCHHHHTGSLDAGQTCCVQITYMQDVKAAFLAQDALAVVAALVAEPLGKLPRSLQRQEELLLQLVITFLRNLLAIPDRSATAGRHSSFVPAALRQLSLGCAWVQHACMLGHLGLPPKF